MQIFGKFVKIKPKCLRFADSLSRKFSTITQDLKTKVFQIPPFTVLYARNQEHVNKNQLLAQISYISRQKRQRDDATQIIFSELEGEIYHNDLHVISQFNDFEDLSIESKDWGGVWVLSGKIYQSPITSYFFSQSGDWINQNCVLNQIQWVSPFNCEIIIEPEKKDKNVSNLFLKSQNLDLQNKDTLFYLNEDILQYTKNNNQNTDIQSLVSSVNKYNKDSKENNEYKDGNKNNKTENGLLSNLVKSHSSKLNIEKIKTFKRHKEKKNQGNIRKEFTILQNHVPQKELSFSNKSYPHIFLKKPILLFQVNKIDYKKLGYVFSFNFQYQNQKSTNYEGQFFSLVSLNKKTIDFTKPTQSRPPKHFFFKSYINQYQTNTGGFFYLNDSIPKFEDLVALVRNIKISINSILPKVYLFNKKNSHIKNKKTRSIVNPSRKDRKYLLLPIKILTVENKTTHISFGNLSGKHNLKNLSYTDALTLYLEQLELIQYCKDYSNHISLYYVKKNFLKLKKDKLYIYFKKFTNPSRNVKIKHNTSKNNRFSFFKCSAYFLTQFLWIPNEFYKLSVFNTEKKSKPIRSFGYQ